MVVRQQYRALRSSLPQSLWCLLAAIMAISLPSASAQIDIVEPTPTNTPASASATTLSIVTLSGSRSRMSSLAAPTSTSLASRPSSIDDAPGGSTFSQNDDDSNNDGIDDRRGMINYYFVFIALFIVLAFLGVFFLNRRRQARKRALLYGGQNALRRDVDGWMNSNARRWHRREESRRMEGLNELGEAPPAYAPPPGKGDDMGNGPAVPLATLARNAEDRNMNAKPPEYTEAMRSDSTIGEHPQNPTQGTSSGPAQGSTRGSPQ